MDYTSNYYNELCYLWECFPDDINCYDLLQYYFNLYMNRFEYEGTPKSIDKVQMSLKQLDRYLWYASAVAMFEDPVLGLQILPVANCRNFNIAFYPKKWKCYGANGYQSPQLDDSNSVLFFNDDSRRPPIVFVYKYIQQILKCEESADMNLDWQKFPFIFETDEDVKKSDELFFKKFKNFSRLIFYRKGGKNKIAEASKMFSTMPHLLASELLATGDKYEQKILSYLGINNIEHEKAERLIVSEANANNEKVYSQYTSAFKSRELSINKANEMFGTNIKIVVPELFKLKVQNDDLELNQGDQNYDKGNIRI